MTITELVRRWTMPKTEPEWSEDAEKRFKYCLRESKVKLNAEIIDGILRVRPENVDKFMEFCNENGLSHEPVAQMAIDYLRTNPGKFLRFTH